MPSESTDSYFETLKGYLTTHGCPTAFYSDKHTVFRVNRPDAKGGSGMTQFGRALAELNIEILCANSSKLDSSDRSKASSGCAIALFLIILVDLVQAFVQCRFHGRDFVSFRADGFLLFHIGGADRRRCVLLPYLRMPF